MSMGERLSDAAVHERKADKRKRSVKAAKAIASDIADRRGIGDELDQIDRETRKEMIEEWAKIIETTL